MVEHKSLAEAFIAASAEMDPAVRNKINPHFRSSYVDLAAAISAATPALHGHGIAIYQFPKVLVVNERPYQALRVKMVHVSGEFEEGDYLLTPAKENDPQALASCYTYARRNTFMGAAGLAPEDDDGNEASGRKQKDPPKVESKDAPKPEPKADKLTAAEISDVRQALEKVIPGERTDKEVQKKRAWYIGWAAGRLVDRLSELTPAEGAAVLTKARAGEMPPS